MVVQPRKQFLTLQKISIFVCANSKFMHFNCFHSFLFMVHTYCVIFVKVLHFFLRKILKLKFGTRKKSTFRQSLAKLSSQVKSKAKSNQFKSIKSDEFNSRQVKYSQIKSSQVRSSQVRLALAFCKAKL